MQAMHGRLGEPREYQALQHFITQSPWEAARVWTQLRAVVPLRAGILAIDDTGFPKQGSQSPGVQRQHCGALGKIGNCQVPVSSALIADGRAGVRSLPARVMDGRRVDYDAFDRPTRTTYPDGTYEQTTYRFLDPLLRRDRLGRITRYTYDAARRLTSVQDPLGRVITQEWCSCGSLDALVDANGNRTSWERDVQRRVTREVRANGAATQYSYETRTSRLKSITDPKQQVTIYTYALDGQLTGMTYTNAQIATPSVSFTYDPVFGRLATMVDGIGTTTYSYHPITTPGTRGATQLASVDGPLSNDTIAYTYDQLSRVTTRAINGVSVTWAFDALGRVTSEASVLGTFTYAYDGPTDRVATVTYPNGLTSTYAYFGNSSDRRLQTIHHRYPNSDTLSKFDYTYDAAGNILSWRQQADTTAVLWEYGYDRADQLLTAVKKSTDPTPTIVTRYAYAYDPAGNRLVEQIDDAVVGATYNNVNELVSQGPSGLIRFEGTVSEPATVTVGGRPALVAPDGSFSASLPVTAGSNVVTITAVDGAGNSTADTYQVTSSGTQRTFDYDANGNLISDGVRTFEWNARNLLTAVDSGSRRTELTYDGLGRHVEMTTEEGTANTVRRFIWDGWRSVQERDASNQVVREILDRGERVGASPVFTVGDHLGSLRAETNSSGGLLANFGYTPFGARVGAVGSSAASTAYAGLLYLPDENLSLTRYRAYDSHLGRWISPDPLIDAAAVFGPQPGAGWNRYRYVSNNPMRFIDPSGLIAVPAVIVICKLTPDAIALAIAAFAVIVELTCKDCAAKREEERRCLEVMLKCKQTCTENGGWQGRGSSAPSVWRRCVRECMVQEGCNNF
jgi:RHS repeat-associated protein